MQRIITLLMLSCSIIFTSTNVSAQNVFTSVEEASSNPDFLLQGEYIGEPEGAPKKGVQVVALGKGMLRVVIHNGGLPGAGWDRKPPQILEEDDTDGVKDLIAALSLKKVSRSSTTLGAKPPQGAVVLFDGTQATFDQHWKTGARMSDDGLLMEGATSTDNFQDFSAHIEFFIPFMPEARGQGRGNSGAYYQGRYETQILDSFGLEGLDNETGGIYTIRKPDLNLSFPPLTWQTYDADFTAARWDENGKKISNARLTVMLNGIVVQRDIEVPTITRAAPVQESPEPGPLYLQNHGNPVRYRNIWVVTRDAEQEARRPILPGFERFHANAEESPMGGTYLLGELGCVNCHKAEEVFAKQLNIKQAPILSNIGSRVKPEWMLNFIANPHESKPGTTMPALFDGWSEKEKYEAALALTNFLAGTGKITDQTADNKAIQRGRRLFHEVGCVACHSPQEGDVKVAASTSVPLANLKEKYSIPSLTQFLKDPHAIRPSGRMPSLNLDKDEPGDIAQYLLAGAINLQVKNVRFTAYHGDWQELPDFDSLKVQATGTCAGFDTTVAGKPHQFGIRYEGYLNVETAGEYRFWLGSDDGSVLTIDGKEVANSDGIHPHSIDENTINLTAGVHNVGVDYFEQAGDVSLTLEMQPPGGQRQDATAAFTLNEDGSPIETGAEIQPLDSGQLAYHRDPQLFQEGQKLFGSLGCASCHELKLNGEKIASTVTAKSLTELDLMRGCLSKTTTTDKNIPNYDLSPSQLAAITRAVSQTEVVEQVTEEALIHNTLATFNCYACHERNNLGGPEFSRNELFITTQHEMGDEGRVPPPIDGVGDKLKESWLKQVMNNGANDRPYMLTRMPKFGGNNVGHLTQAFIKLDQKIETQLAKFDEPEHRVKATGRELVGSENLACIKCHTFGNHKASGIQAIALTSMTKRIREDWFLRYLFEPAKYRPGTRMPTGYPDGKAVVQTIYHGDPNQQLSAIWLYLSDETKAGIPDGLIVQMEELKPVDEPIIYRNFIDGLSPRGIAVGYPEQANLAWDANDLSLKLIWHHRFIDSSMHWAGRGQGNQAPLGDHILKLEPTIPFAELKSLDTPWPTESPKTQPGFQFKGYQLNKLGQPKFMYEIPNGNVQDFPEPIAHNQSDPSLKRTLTINLIPNTENRYFRAAVGAKIEKLDNGYLIDGAMTMRVKGGGEPFIRESNGKQELLVPIAAGPTQITQEILW